MATDRLAVVDLGSNSFRLVVFTRSVPDAAHPWWKRTDEIFETVRIGEGQAEGGPLQPEPIARALDTLALFAHFCRAMGIEDVRPVATSAIREATNRDNFLARARERSGWDIRVLSREEEGRYGYLAAVNSTTLTDGLALDLGGGSLQLIRVAGRHATAVRSWRLGAVVTTEAFLPGGRAKPKQLRALRAHVAAELEAAPWAIGAGAADGRRLTGVGGTVRNLASAAEIAAGLPSYGIQGYRLHRAALDALVERLAALPPEERGQVPGLKPERGDLILAGAVVVQSVMEVCGFEQLEATEAGLREGVFFESLLEPADPPLFQDVRSDAVCNLAAQYETDFAHARHVARLSLEMWDALGEQGIHPARPDERELLWAAAMLHDIGTAVDYDDHHKHSRYLILSASLPGFSPREIGLVGQMARYHRKGIPALGEFAGLARPGDDRLLGRCAAILRLAEQLERSRDQTVRHARVTLGDGRVHLSLESDDDVSVARWAVQRQRELFERAFGQELAVAA